MNDDYYETLITYKKNGKRYIGHFNVELDGYTYINVNNQFFQGKNLQEAEEDFQKRFNARNTLTYEQFFGAE
jgi:hypothetical protein